MSKTVLLIESDPKFAREMSAALESRGFGVRTSSDGKEGVELARALRPDCVVLCVELPGLSGYSWCNRLKKDDVLKAIPLVITSSEATPETFEQHRKLKTRAEDYLIKPFQPTTLVERVGALVGMPEGPRPTTRNSSPSPTWSWKPEPAARRRTRRTRISRCSTTRSTTSAAAEATSPARALRRTGVRATAHAAARCRRVSGGPRPRPGDGRGAGLSRRGGVRLRPRGPGCRPLPGAGPRGPSGWSNRPSGPR